MMAALKDANGRISVPGFYDGVRRLPVSERRLFADLPHSDRRYKTAIGAPELHGEAGYSTLERIWARPTLDINGIWSGFTGEGAKTVIPAEAYAKISMRLVPDQTPKDIARKVAFHLKKIAPKSVKVTVEELHGGDPWVAPREHPALQAAGRALERAFDRRPVFVREGGSDSRSSPRSTGLLKAPHRARRLRLERRQPARAEREVRPGELLQGHGGLGAADGRARGARASGAQIVSSWGTVSFGRRSAAAAGALLAILLIGCGAPRSTSTAEQSASTAERTTLTVSTAISLAPALEDSAVLFLKDWPELYVEFNAGGSRVLYQQITKGVASDVFISATALEIDQLIEQGLADASTRRPLASNTLVVVVPSGSTPPADVTELTDERFARFAVANPQTAALGFYTHRAMVSLDLWQSLRRRVVLAQNARQALDYVVRGEVDVAVVYEHDLPTVEGQLVVGPKIRPDLHPPDPLRGRCHAGVRQPR